MNVTNEPSNLCNVSISGIFYFNFSCDKYIEFMSQNTQYTEDTTSKFM